MKDPSNIINIIANVDFLVKIEKKMSSKVKRKGKGGKYKRNRKTITISKEDKEFLVSRWLDFLLEKNVTIIVVRTNYDADEIEEWYSGFMEVSITLRR